MKSAKVFGDPDDFNGHLKRTFQRAEKLNTEKKNFIDQERDKYIQQLKKLDG